MYVFRESGSFGPEVKSQFRPVGQPRLTPRFSLRRQAPVRAPSPACRLSTEARLPSIDCRHQVAKGPAALITPKSRVQIPPRQKPPGEGCLARSREPNHNLSSRLGEPNHLTTRPALSLPDTETFGHMSRPARRSGGATVSLAGLWRRRENLAPHANSCDSLRKTRNAEASWPKRF